MISNQDHWGEKTGQKVIIVNMFRTLSEQRKRLVEQDTIDWNSQRGGRPRRNLGKKIEMEPLKEGQTWNDVKNWLRIGSNGRTL